jgi:phage terminase small subunit
MAGRPSKPVQLIKLEGNKDRRTKAELEHREKFEKSLYTGTSFKESPEVKADPVAHKEFLRLKKLYKHIQYVDGLDEQIINRYCLMISQERSLQNTIKKLNEDIENADDFDTRSELYKLLASLTTKLNQTRDMILKLEDRLFLNPTARVKAIPKKPPDDDTKKSPMAEFLKRRAGGNNAT